MDISNMSELKEFFILDAKDAISNFEEILSDTDNFDVESFEVIAHGMKSALANMGEAELSAVAKSLEQAAQGGDVEFILKETPGFMKALKCYAEKLENE